MLSTQNGTQTLAINGLNNLD